MADSILSIAIDARSMGAYDNLIKEDSYDSEFLVENLNNFISLCRGKRKKIDDSPENTALLLYEGFKVISLDKTSEIVLQLIQKHPVNVFRFIAKVNKNRNHVTNERENVAQEVSWETYEKQILDYLHLHEEEFIEHLEKVSLAFHELYLKEYAQQIKSEQQEGYQFTKRLNQSN